MKKNWKSYYGEKNSLHKKYGLVEI